MLIENGIVFTGEQFVSGLSVRLQNGIVSEVVEKTAADSTETRIDLEGGFLLPGFVDVHIRILSDDDECVGGRHTKRVVRYTCCDGASGKERCTHSRRTYGSSVSQ